MKKNNWTWKEIHTLGRQSLDGGVRMVCERLAGKVAKNIKLLNVQSPFVYHHANQSQGHISLLSV